VARSLGEDAKTVRKYVAPAEASGWAPSGPPVTEEQWRAIARQWFPSLAGTRLRQPSWDEIAAHRDRIEALLGVVPVSVIHQRLSPFALLSRRLCDSQTVGPLQVREASAATGQFGRPRSGGVRDGTFVARPHDRRAARRENLDVEGHHQS